jgi:hypothetical protein
LFSTFSGLFSQNKMDTTKINLKDSLSITKKDSLFKDTAIAATKNVFDSRIKYTARDSMVMDNPNEMIYLYGLGTVNYETMDLKAGYISINNKNKLVDAQYVLDSAGKKTEAPAFTDGSQAFDADKMVYNMDTKKGKIYEALTKQEKLLVYGKAIKKDSSKIIYVKDAKCIPCEYADAQTYFQTKKAKIIPDDKVITGPVFLVLAGIPTPLGLPFGFFPSTRKKRSGIIIPQFRDAASLGIGLVGGGYYWGINDYTDLTVTGDIFTTGSWTTRIANRYRINYKMTGNLEVNISRNVGPTGDLPGADKTLNYRINWSHAFDQKFLGDARLSANIDYVGNAFNRVNEFNINTNLNTNINSGIAYSKNFKNFNITSSIQLRQDKTKNTVAINFPNLSFALNPVKLFPNAATNSPLKKIQFNYSSNFNATATTKENSIFTDSTRNLIKSGLTQNASISHFQVIAKYFNFSNSINLSGKAYLQTIRKVDITSIKGEKVIEEQVFDPRAFFNVSYSTGLTTTGIFGNYYYKSKILKQIRHRMDPSVSFSYTPYLGESFYKQKRSYTEFRTKEEIEYSIFENTLFGGPGTSESGNLSFNLANTFEAKVRDKTDTGVTYKKVSLLNAFNLSTSYNLFAKTFQWSPLFISYNTNLFNKIQVQGSFGYSFYGIDNDLKPVNRSAYEVNQKLLRFTGAELGFSTTIDKKDFLSKKDPEKGAEDFIWNLMPTVSCAWRPDPKTNKITPEISTRFSSHIELTKKWKFDLTSGYNLQSKEIVSSSIGVIRDLRCWQMAVQWIPFGFTQGYTISLSLKNEMFKDFAIPRRRNWQDNGNLVN